MLHWIHVIEDLVKINAIRIVCSRNFLSVWYTQTCLSYARESNLFPAQTQVFPLYLFGRPDRRFPRIFNAGQPEKIPPLIRRNFRPYENFPASL
jgi:hypothetical protein